MESPIQRIKEYHNEIKRLSDQLAELGKIIMASKKPLESHPELVKKIKEFALFYQQLKAIHLKILQEIKEEELKKPSSPKTLSAEAASVLQDLSELRSHIVGQQLALARLYGDKRLGELHFLPGKAKRSSSTKEGAKKEMKRKFKGMKEREKWKRI